MFWNLHILIEMCETVWPRIFIGDPRFGLLPAPGHHITIEHSRVYIMLREQGLEFLTSQENVIRVFDYQSTSHRITTKPPRAAWHLEILSMYKSNLYDVKTIINILCVLLSLLQKFEYRHFCDSTSLPWMGTLVLGEIIWQHCATVPGEKQGSEFHG